MQGLVRHGLVVAALAGMLAACGKKEEEGARRGGGGPTPVRVATVARMDAPVTVTASGIVEPAQTVAVAAQANGVLRDVLFREGDWVQAGQVLFRIDPGSLTAAVAQARATLARDEAQAEAARRDDIRYQALVRQDYVTREQADQVHATALAAAATVEADRAAVRAAEVNLGYATIRAPITGRTGSLLARAGNVVGPTSGPLVVINQLQPILVRFPILSQDLPLLQAAVARAPLPVTVTGSDSAGASERGTLSFLDNAVDSLTGTVTGKAELRNDGRRLWPGELVFLEVRAGVQPNVLAVPTAALLTGQQGRYVYVVVERPAGADSSGARKGDGKSSAKGDSAQRGPSTVVQTRPVVVGRTVGDFTIVERGVAEREVVVVDGQSKLKSNARVAVVRDRPTNGDTATGGRTVAEGGRATANAGGEVTMPAPAAQPAAAPAGGAKP